MLVKLFSGRNSSSQSIVDIRTAPTSFIEVSSNCMFDNGDLCDVLFARQVSMDRSSHPHYLTFFCQNIFHNDLSRYQLEEQQPAPAPVNPFLSPVRALRFVREYLDVTALDLRVPAHSALAFALSRANHPVFSAYSARDIFDSLTECALAVNSSDSKLGSHSLLRGTCEEQNETPSAWRFEGLRAAVQSVNMSSGSWSQKIQVEEDLNGTSRAGLLLQLVSTDNSNRTRGSADIVARVVLDARALSPNSSSTSRVRSLLRPLAIVVETKLPGQRLLLLLTLIVADSPKIELLGPFQLVRSLLIYKPRVENCVI